MGSMKKLIKIAIGILLVGIIVIATDFYLLWLPLEHSPEYPAKVAALFMAVTALVTLLLALTTVKATEQSNLREKNRRTDEIKKEKRDRKERLLNEIIEWAEDIAEGGSKEELQTTMEVSDQTLQRIDIDNLLRRYKTALVRVIYMCEIALVFGEDLHTAVVETTKELLKFSAVKIKHLVGKTTQKSLSEQELSLFKHAQEVIEEAVKIKTKDIS